MFQQHGIKKIKNFLSEEVKNNINTEIDDISKKYLINGVTRASTWHNKNLYEISNPIVNINNINLLEIALDVHEILKKETSNNYVLTRFRIIIEKNNGQPIGWHTDRKPNTIRAIIYLMGGEIGNGSLSYIRGSHKIIHDKKIHKIDPKKEDLEDKIENIDSKVGDLIFFDINGFHKKNVVFKERRVLFIEFQDENSSIEKQQIVLDNSKISPKIKKKLDFLFFAKEDTKLAPPDYSNSVPENTPFALFFVYIKTFFHIFLKRFLGKLKLK